MNLKQAVSVIVKMVTQEGIVCQVKDSKGVAEAIDLCVDFVNEAEADEPE